MTKLSFIFVLLLLPLILAARMVEQEETFVIKDQTLSIDLEVEGGIIEVKPSNDRRDCFVFMSYPSEKCDVRIRYNQSRSHLDISIDNEKWDFDDDEEKAPLLLLELPFGPEISLTSHIKAGETTFNLGDLKLVDFELRHWAGETDVDFAKPNLVEMRTFDVNVKVGEVELLNLSNARFEDADINSGIGELTVDFNGKGTEQATARIDLDIGETTIILPDHIGTKLKVSKFLFLSDISYPDWFEKQGNYYYSDNYDESEQSLYLMISTGIGELKIKVE